MSTPAFGFDFSQMNPYITGIMDRSLRAMDYNLAQQPKRDTMNDRAYAEWLNNNASKRGIAEQDSRLRTRGFDAAESLSKRRLQEERDAKAAAVMERRAALSTPPRDRANLGTLIGGPHGLALHDYNSKLSDYARGGITMPWNMGYQPGRPSGS